MVGTISRVLTNEQPQSYAEPEGKVCIDLQASKELGPSYCGCGVPELGLIAYRTSKVPSGVCLAT